MNITSRKLLFRMLAGLFAAGMLIFGAVIISWGVSGERSWSYVVTHALLQIVCGSSLGLYALGLPGPHGQSSRNRSAPDRKS